MVSTSTITWWVHDRISHGYNNHCCSKYFTHPNTLDLSVVGGFNLNRTGCKDNYYMNCIMCQLDDEN